MQNLSAAGNESQQQVAGVRQLRRDLRRQLRVRPATISQPPIRSRLPAVVLSRGVLSSCGTHPQKTGRNRYTSESGPLMRVMCRPSCKTPVAASCSSRRPSTARSGTRCMSWRRRGGCATSRVGSPLSGNWWCGSRPRRSGERARHSPHTESSSHRPSWSATRKWIRTPRATRTQPELSLARLPRGSDLGLGVITFCCQMLWLFRVLQV